MIIENTNQEAQFSWGDTFLQGGDSGLVITSKGSYTTAFVEAFPKELKTFIRGEGSTISEAENSAWEQYQKILNCTIHEFELRNYRNGSGFCKHCDFFANDVFEPAEKCTVCGCNAFWKSDIENNYYCKEHADQIPIDKTR